MNHLGNVKIWNNKDNCVLLGPAMPLDRPVYKYIQRSQFCPNHNSKKIRWAPLGCAADSPHSVCQQRRAERATPAGGEHCQMGRPSDCTTVYKNRGLVKHTFFSSGWFPWARTGLKMVRSWGGACCLRCHQDSISSNVHYLIWDLI